jgi:hypothetical protein
MKCVLVDLDGTLCNLDHRLHYISGADKTKDWDSFYYHCDKDTPNIGVVEWVRALDAGGISVIIVSGRRWTCLFATFDWLSRYQVPYSSVYMARGVGDFRPDTEIKEEILEELLESDFEILFVIDDRPSVCEMWRKKGLKVYPVHQERWT